MSRVASTVVPLSTSGPAWEIALLFPPQGFWSIEDYLELSERTNGFVELCDGRVEVPELPGLAHQRIVAALQTGMNDFARPLKLGEAVIAPYPVKLAEQIFREPDVVFVSAEHRSWLGERFAEGADLVVEVLSQDRSKDLVTKRREYAAAVIREYWLVDIRDSEITVLVLDGDGYREHGRYRKGERAASTVLAGFSVDVTELMSLTE